MSVKSILFRIKLAKLHKINENICMRLRDYRKKLNLTQEQVAKYLNINQRTYSGYEIGTSEPNNETLIKLAELFHISVDEILGREVNFINLEALETERKEVVLKVLNMPMTKLNRLRDFLKGMME